MKLAHLASQPLLEADGEKSDYRLLDDVVKEPENDERGGKSELHHAGVVVADASIICVADDIREVWRHAADDEGRPNQVQSAKGQNSRDMGDRKRHPGISWLHLDAPASRFPARHSEESLLLRQYS